MNPEVDAFFRKAKKWQAEMKSLRAIVLASGLTEELKWYQPCYTYNETNVAIISAFKEYCVLSFFKGVLLKDAKGILSSPGENSQSVRMAKFTCTKEIAKLAPTLKSYIKEAIATEKAGLKVSFKKITEHPVPDELKSKYKELPALKVVFETLTPGRQRAYLLHFSSAKQSATRTARIENCMPQILKGKGLND